MSKYTAWIIRKQYYKVEVDADSWEDARDKIQNLDIELDIDKPDDIDWDIYDIEEVKE